MSAGHDGGGYRGPSDGARRWQERAHRAIPGGAHTYAKGDDQYPACAPPVLVRGRGARVWDVDGNEFVEYGGGLRANVLGHAHPGVVAAVRAAVAEGTNFVRPSTLEVEVAEQLLDFVGRPDWMVKFTKNGSDANGAAIRLARAVTGRDRVARCTSHPFFSVEDWFIGTTAMDAGIPRPVTDLVDGFAYGDLDGLAQVLAGGDVAAVILEAAKYEDPPPGFLDGVRRLCDDAGTVFVLDEMITGFRWPDRTALQHYAVEADLVTYGKGMGNGLAASALVGRPELMARGGLHHDAERVFLLSYTHGAEHTGLAAAAAVMDAYVERDGGTAMAAFGARLSRTLNDISADLGIADHLLVDGPGQNLVFVTRDAGGEASQVFRALAMQELIRHGVIGPSLVVCTAHGDAELEVTAEAWRAAGTVYARALEDGPDGLLEGHPTSPVFRRFNQ